MKRREILQQRSVIAKTPEEWDMRVNEALVELTGNAKNTPTLTRTIKENSYEAIIDYYIVVETPENATDRAHIRGEYHTCDECPHLVKKQDKRFKNLECDNGQRVIACRCDEACEWFYERLEGAK